MIFVSQKFTTYLWIRRLLDRKSPWSVYEFDYNIVWSFKLA